MKRLGILILLIGLVGCAGSLLPVPGDIIETTSKFDGSRQISIEPAWVGNSIKLTLFKNTKMPVNDIILTVVVRGARLFAKGNSLHFNVDGKIVSFKSIDRLTDIKTSSGFAGGGYYIPPSNWSSKAYVVGKSFIKRIIAANRVVVKIDLTKTYVEGVFSKDGYTRARPAFKKFYARLKTL